jgi:hypothetical protein
MRATLDQGAMPPCGPTGRDVKKFRKYSGPVSPGNGSIARGSRDLNV